MPLDVCTDLSPAAWIVNDPADWSRVARFGPSTFPAYARLRFIPDPAGDRQEHSSITIDPGAVQDDVQQLGDLLELLAADTTDPDDCFFALWEGWPLADQDAARTWPRFSIPRGARFPARSYYLFHGPLREIGDWGRPEFENGDQPAYIWPADHTWCVANDIDPHWASIGAARPTIERLGSHSELDIVPADPEAPVPTYK